MKRCEHVEHYDGFNHDLEETAENNHYKLKEVEGVISFCETNERGLIIRLDNLLPPETNGVKEIIWPFENARSLPAICGQGLRCFYEKTSQKENDKEIIFAEAYELLHENNLEYVIRRAAMPGGYKFVGGG